MRAPLAEASPQAVSSCLAAECARWQHLLGWDLTRDWADVLPAWQAGQVRVWGAHDTGTRDATWAFAVPTSSALQVGAVVAPDAERYAALVQEIGDSAPGVLAFVREQRLTDAAAWLAIGASVDRVQYLVAPAVDSGPPVGRPFRPETDRDALVRLLHDAYAPAAYLRAFAPGGTLGEWASYVEGLLTRPGCGQFHADASVVVHDDAGMIGVCLLSIVGPSMAHVPQVVVAPRAAGRGLGAALVRAARTQAAARLGCAAVSLMVSQSNEGACRLYAREGFVERGAFLTVRRD